MVNSRDPESYQKWWAERHLQGQKASRERMARNARQAARLGLSMPRYYLLRNRAIYKAWLERKWTLASLGQQFGLSGNRIRQIVFRMRGVG